MNFFIGSDILPNRNFPIIFECVKGECQKSDDSFFNSSEILAALRHIDSLVNLGISPKDIGVLSPYRVQYERIRSFSTNKDITVGSAEMFQGQERPVTIISTVRTDGDLGFVRDPQVRPNYICN